MGHISRRCVPIIVSSALRCFIKKGAAPLVNLPRKKGQIRAIPDAPSTCPELQAQTNFACSPGPILAKIARYMSEFAGKQINCREQ